MIKFEISRVSKTAHELARLRHFASCHVPLGSRCNMESAVSTVLSTIFVPPLASHASAQTPAALNTHPTTSCRTARSVLSSRGTSLTVTLGRHGWVGEVVSFVEVRTTNVAWGGSDRIAVDANSNPPALPPRSRPRYTAWPWDRRTCRAFLSSRECESSVRGGRASVATRGGF